VDQLINDTSRVADIADRVAAKVDRYAAALDRLAAAVAAESDKLSSLVPCCFAAGQPAHQWRPSRSFGGLTINRAASCELLSNWSAAAPPPPSPFAKNNNSLLRQIVAACVTVTERLGHAYVLHNIFYYFIFQMIFIKNFSFV
jgi:hypothetical protein